MRLDFCSEKTKPIKGVNTAGLAPRPPTAVSATSCGVLTLCFLTRSIPARASTVAISLRSSIKGVNTAGLAPRPPTAVSATSCGVLSPLVSHSLDHARASTIAISLRSSIKLIFLWVLFSLFVFFTSCENDSGKNNSGDDFSKRPYALDSLLIGKWRSLPYENAEGYNISETLFEYQDGQEPGVWDISYKGVVRYVKSFDSKSGVIIIEYTGGGWPRYTEEGHTISAWVGTPIPGPFFGVYYSNLVEDSVTLANSTTLDSIPPYKPPETASLEEAIAKFTLENRSRFVAGVAVPQKRWE